MEERRNGRRGALLETKYATSLTPVHGLLFYIWDGSLWRTDGTPSGDVLVSKSLTAWTAAGPIIYFSEQTGTADDIYATEDGIAGAVAYHLDATWSDSGQRSGPLIQLTPIGSSLYYVTGDWGPTGAGSMLWRNGQALILPPRVRARTWRAGGSDFIVDHLTSAGDRLLFAYSDSAYGQEPYFCEPGKMPVLLADVNPGPGDSNPSQFIQVGSKLFFVADDGMHGPELMVADMPPGGTQPSPITPPTTPPSEGPPVSSPASSLPTSPIVTLPVAASVPRLAITPSATAPTILVAGNSPGQPQHAESPGTQHLALSGRPLPWLSDWLAVERPDTQSVVPRWLKRWWQEILLDLQNLRGYVRRLAAMLACTGPECGHTVEARVEPPASAADAPVTEAFERRPLLESGSASGDAAAVASAADAVVAANAATDSPATRGNRASIAALAGALAISLLNQVPAFRKRRRSARA